ncbi:dipeptide ABC transporter ATP-binding protein [Amycolatopsis thermoflava]|uniref:dipeptide ABC transporter ATP-binding protein n=1 Tax=Amycolatopsis thermoflava TaxID=84480 RepID=UPI003650BE4A
MVTLLRVDGLRVAYGGAEAVRGVDFTVARGETVALVGESGSGKSTVAHAVLRLLPPGGRITGGTISLGDEELTRAAESRMRQLRGSRVALVPQDPLAYLNPVKRIGEQVAEVRRIHRLAAGERAAADAVKLLTTAGLPDAAKLARRYPHELSGGMRQRVLIAIALAAEPALIVADEPTSALDVTVQRVILDHLGGLSRELGIAVLLITHDLAVAAERADRVLVMRAGEIVEHGPAGLILSRPAHDYTRALVASVPGGRAPEPPATDRSHPLVEVEQLRRSFPGQETPAVDGVTLAVAPGQALGLVGESGSGKSTVARLIACLDRPSAGRVVLDGTDTATASGGRLRALRRTVQLIQQSPYTALDPRFSAGRSVAEPLRAFGIGDRRSRRARVAELFDLVRLPRDLLTRRPGELSGGQRQRVAIARALALEPRLLVCDEPVSALDVTVQSAILDLLAELRAEFGLAYVFISHDLAVVRQLCDRVAVMRRGRIVEAGATEALFTNPGHDYTRELLDAIPKAATASRATPDSLYPAGTR